VQIVATALWKANGKVGIGLGSVSVSEYFGVFILEIPIEILVRLRIRRILSTRIRRKCSISSRPSRRPVLSGTVILSLDNDYWL
jgi:hypothetical protein